MGLDTQQLPRAHDVIDLGRESTTAIVLSQHDPKLHSKYLSLYPQASVNPTPHQGNVSLCETEVIT